MTTSVWCAAGLCLALAAPVGGQGQAQPRGNNTMRFQRMDTSGDGVITRDEWRGNDRSFADHDCNGDGVLSGPEVRPGAQPCRRSRATHVAAPTPSPSPKPSPQPSPRYVPGI